MENKIFKIENIQRLMESKEVEEIIECISKVELQASPIGWGSNAEVYIPIEESFKKVCIKKSIDKPKIVFNDIHEECRLQKQVKQFGVRTPLTLLSFNTENKSWLMMETIDGHTVKEVLGDNSLLPEKFDYKTFCDSLDEQITKMHKGDSRSEGIYHRDLHDGNVMIDKEGLPVIIDYGTAVEGSGSSFTYEESVKMYNTEKGRYEFVENYFKDDLEMVKNIKNELKIFMK